MTKDPKVEAPSALEEVTLSFEYDVPWQAIKKATRKRSQ